jgi:hypothetical protein
VCHHGAGGDVPEGVIDGHLDGAEGAAPLEYEAASVYQGEKVAHWPLAGR